MERLKCSNFCPSAKHNSSPNTYSIDRAALISSGSGCSGTVEPVQTASVSEDADCTIRQRRQGMIGTSYEAYYDLSRHPSPRPDDRISSDYLNGERPRRRMISIIRLYSPEAEHARDAEEAEYYKSNGRSDEITNYCPVTNWEALNRYCGKPDGCTTPEYQEQLIEAGQIFEEPVMTAETMSEYCATNTYGKYNYRPSMCDTWLSRNRWSIVIAIIHYRCCRYSTRWVNSHWYLHILMSWMFLHDHSP